MKLHFALVGNQNCGKSTLFNYLTGSNQHVGNFPGVTVQKKEGTILAVPDAGVIDLPGIYSLSPYTSEEIVTRDLLLYNKPDAIINVIDATNIERSLYLSLQLIELNIPMVIALNMMDELTGSGGSIDIKAMEDSLTVPVVPITSNSGEGVGELLRRAVEVAQNQQLPQRLDFCSGPVHTAIHSIAHLIETKARRQNLPLRFTATKLIEGDSDFAKALQLSENECDIIGHFVTEMEQNLKTDKEAALADMRYAYIEDLCAQTVQKPKHTEAQLRSVKIDHYLTHKFYAIPIFVLIMGLVFWLTFDVIGAFLSDILSNVIDAVTASVDNTLTVLDIAPPMHSLIIDGIFSGVGAVLSFLPTIVTLFFFLSMLEDSGYMARVAFIMDRIFRKFGLSGKSFIPMLIGSGCGVPGIMASRTIENDRDRKMTIMTTTFVPCGAKLPIIAMIAGAFFDNSGWVATSCYFVGIAAIICSGIILKKTKMFAGDPAPFVMELPAYHWPTVSNVLRSMWERGWSFIKKAGTIILLSTIVLWFLMSFGWESGSFGMVEELNNSILASIGSAIAWIFAPLGWTKAGEGWKMAVAAITGLIAKENVVATFGMLYGFGEVAEDGAEIWGNLAAAMTPIAAYGFLVFNLLCAPCFAAMGAIKREMNNAKWFWFAIGYQCGLAYVVSLCIFQIGTLITTGAFGIGTVAAFLLVIGFLYLLFRPYKESSSLKVDAKKVVSAK